MARARGRLRAARTEEDAHNRDAVTLVQGEEAVGTHRLGEAVTEARELALGGADVRAETRARIVEREDERQAERTRDAARDQVDQPEL